MSIQVKSVLCPECNGRKKVQLVCNHCKGGRDKINCGFCKGIGFYFETCRECRGSGVKDISQRFCYKHNKPHPCKICLELAE